MLPRETERRIADMLDAGRPQGEIADVTGASRWTVDAIASGRRPRYLPRQVRTVRFRELKCPRLCGGCSKHAGRSVYVGVSPCPACLAR